MRRIVTLLCASCFFLFGCSEDAPAVEEEKQPSSVCDVDCTQENKANMSEYAVLEEEDHVFLEITMQQANEYMKDTAFTGILYYGYPGCPWCEEAVPIMNEVAKENDLTIYYINKKSEENIAHPEWEKEAITLLSAAFELDKDEETGETKLYVPEVVVVDKGEIIAHHTGTVEGHNAHEREMNENEKKLLESIYEKKFKKIN